MTPDAPHLLPIGDLDDPRVAPFRALRERELRKSSEARERGWFVAEGKLVFERLLASRFRVVSVFVDEKRVEELRPLLERLPTDTPVYTAPIELHAQISGAKFHQGLLALGESGPALEAGGVIERAEVLVVLEGLVNHDNLGAVFRNVAALAGEKGAVLLDPRSVDPLYRKSIRVSMGWALHVPFARLAPWPAALERVKAAGFTTLALTPRAGAVDLDRVASMRPKRIALLVGAEEPGLSEDALAAADLRVRIPIAEHVDSLNLAAATAIALYGVR
ncbi:MAG: RNA methyltransferase [Planctomycetes bacterium]|nr:RNA methyltransferase [Planctomycetota bacterium]